MVLSALAEALQANVPSLQHTAIDTMDGACTGPCLLASLTRDKWTPLNGTRFERRMDAALTIFPGAKEDAAQQSDDLLDMLSQAMAALAPGVLYIGDRALSVRFLDGKRVQDNAVINVRLKFLDMSAPAAPLPTAGALQVKIEKKEGS